MNDQRAALKAVAADARTATSTTVVLVGAAGATASKAADTLAGELRTTVHRIDLSAVVSKYIGETEKHLEAVFRDAEQSGAVLLIDDADALFGARTGVKDAHDRYANLDVTALLARVEQYTGVVLLATNVSTTIDPALRRRLRRVIDYTPD